MTERPIIVTQHAIDQYARRRLDRRPHLEIAAEIRECVEIALKEGNVLNHRPPGFVLYRRKNTQLPEGQRFVQCDKDSNFGFILKRNPDEGDVVVTTLTKAGVRK